MERESTEGDGLINSFLLGNAGGGGDQAQISSSATAILVFSTFIAVCGSFIFGTSIGYSSAAEKVIIDDLGLSVAEYSVFGSIMSIGAMLGAAMSGWIADLIGRSGAMGISDIFCIMGWLAIIFSKATWLLDFGRLFIGCNVVPVYISEIAPPKNLRGRFATVLQVMITSGSSLTFFIGSIVSWRTLALIGNFSSIFLCLILIRWQLCVQCPKVTIFAEIIPCLVQLLGLFIIPESPRWLASIRQRLVERKSVKLLFTTSEEGVTIYLRK
ncbi:hypothetical protein Ddye_028375 [Dipteronia dyeriana]|uniref:Major facilitator superfamily (MFS) profile domain-containing protein n=1 Tax=Dipteronia dyeriana TaxID=168575 RepID=A0AAD9TQV5_9ROSI|nr:hypothetical protein Ddye_028375 [Dipteronia dyeriana]